MNSEDTPIHFSSDERTQTIKSILLQITIGWVGTDLVLWSLYRFVLAPMPLQDPLERMLFTLKWQIYPAAVMLLMVYAIITLRVFNLEAGAYPVKAAFNGQEGKIAVHKAVLRNTVEQWLILLPLILIVSLYLSSPASNLDLRVVVLVTSAFVIGRLVYWVGYVYHSPFRIFGIGMTLHLSLYLVVYGIYHHLTAGS